MTSTETCLGEQHERLPQAHAAREENTSPVGRAAWRRLAAGAWPRLRGRAGVARSGHLLANTEVVLPWTGVPEVAEVFLKPNLQVECGHVVAGGLQQPQRQAAVHAPAQQHGHPQRRAVRLAPARAGATSKTFSSHASEAFARHSSCWWHFKGARVRTQPGAQGADATARREAHRLLRQCRC
jgi:hypothetical protein